MRICVVYDCLYPYTVGGAERWYRNLAERLAEEGHEVTYLTLRQWDRGTRLDLDERIRVVVAGPRMGLYTRGGRRRVLPPLMFGAGVLWHLLRHGRRYEVVHMCSFPYFSLLAAALARPSARFRLLVDWFEVWSDSYWREYLGGLGGRVGGLVQRLCARVPQHAYCFSELHAERLRREGLRGGVHVLRGLYAGPRESGEPAPEREPGTPGTRDSDAAPSVEPATGATGGEADAMPGAQPVVLFAGRLIPEKQAPLGVAAIAAAARQVDGLRGEFLGDGPEREALRAAIAEHDAASFIAARGFTDAATVDREMRSAMCVLLPSRREGYGMVVVEAAARGTPSVVVAGEDNAAAELVVDGVNGVVAERSEAGAIGEAIVRVHAGGAALRASTAAWYAENAQTLSLESSLRTVLRDYAAGSSPAASSDGAPAPSARS